jgi:xanthine phosphoribosyltransferase
MSENKLYLTWEETQRDGELLAEKLNKASQDWRGIIAVTRGGLNPALTLSTELDIRLVETFCMVSYDNDDTQGEAKILKDLKHLGDGAGWIVVDDLVDSGKTFDVIRRQHLPAAHFACLYGKPKGIPFTDTMVKEFPQTTWLNFPWEVRSNHIRPKVK